ncbi:hypothetical protein INR49_006483 [Caranx melampygus]|nr:hypothetical protein INR49_006483 [Caranx melampygus]
MKTETWVAAKPQADIIKLRWDADRGRINYIGSFYTQICPEWLNTYVKYGKNFLLRTVEHSLRFYFTISSGLPNIPDYMGVGNVDGVEVVYCDSSMETPEARQDWVIKFIVSEQEDWERITGYSINYEQQLRGDAASFKQQSNQTEGLHIIQQIVSSEWDNETEKVDGFLQYGYNGDDFLSFDLQTLTWIAANPQAETIKQQWDGNTARSQTWKNYLDNVIPYFLQKAVKFGSGFLQRTVPPSVSLLQKTPSSPVSCHATGFYPHRALLFWTKDGEELHEDKSMTMAVVVAVAVIVVVLIFFVVGFVVYKKKTAELPAPPPGDSELTENLKPT